MPGISQLITSVHILAPNCAHIGYHDLCI